MNLLEILKSECLSILFGGFAGIITSWLTQRVLNKRGVDLLPIKRSTTEGEFLIQQRRGTTHVCKPDMVNDRHNINAIVLVQSSLTITRLHNLII